MSNKYFSQMRAELGSYGQIIMYWPSGLPIDWLLMAKEIVNLQLDQLIRSEKRKEYVDAEYASWFMKKTENQCTMYKICKQMDSEQGKGE